MFILFIDQEQLPGPVEEKQLLSVPVTHWAMVVSTVFLLVHPHLQLWRPCALCRNHGMTIYDNVLKIMKH